MSKIEIDHKLIIKDIFPGGFEPPGFSLPHYNFII